LPGRLRVVSHLSHDRSDPESRAFLARFKARTDGRAPFFASDQLPAYVVALIANYSTPEPPPDPTWPEPPAQRAAAPGGPRPALRAGSKATRRGARGRCQTADHLRLRRRADPDHASPRVWLADQHRLCGARQPDLPPEQRAVSAQDAVSFQAEGLPPIPPRLRGRDLQLRATSQQLATQTAKARGPWPAVGSSDPGHGGGGD
jgi:hypothetical protein